MTSLALELALFALFSCVKTETNGQIITTTVQLHSIVGLQCTSCPTVPESTAVVQWYRSRRSDEFIKDGQALASWSASRTGGSQRFGIEDDFSLNISDVHLSDEGLYRCIVTPIAAAECTHDVKLGIYAKQDSSPAFEYIRQTNGFNVTCSISYVFPMTFPILIPKGRNGTALINIDGTYNTTVTRWFSSNEKNTTIECLYSNFNFKSMSSLRIIGSIDQPEAEDTKEKKSSVPKDTDFKGRPSGLWMVWIILIISVVIFIVIVYAICGRVIVDVVRRKTIRNNPNNIERDVHHRENSEGERPAKSKMILMFGKLSCAVITTIIMILSVAYLATAKF